jgi:prepilin-type N-terminal cleavage/methylation domain-containing protein
MKRADAGYTLIELLVAAALMLLLTAITCHVLVDVRATIDLGAGRADVQQRARVALDTLTARLRGAGAGPDRGSMSGRLMRWAPPLIPGRPGGSASDFSTAVTTFEALASVPPAALAFDAPAGTLTLDFDYAPGCAAPCGFFDRMTVLIADGIGDFDLFVLTAMSGGSASVRRLGIGTGGSYARGSPAVPVDVHVYYLNERARELRLFDGDRSDMPVVNDVVALSFEYTSERADGALGPLDATMLEDGPWCGAGSQPFDADLLRIRAVRVTLRVQAGDLALRGSDTAWFRNAGTAVESARLVKDVTLRTSITPPNLGAWR